ncbi:MAG: 6-carboxytetrahydropterin synthase [Magnetococcales bacterium]|nr:6-carboxytetrahydropterin synthase [Magnetococcales bacterium]MBF0155873.1 6-carboxytetrahydropterin synthase [Magnetococcales bacterium]
MRIGRTFSFEAAHRLEFHDGRCRRLHGHSYRLELVFGGSLRSPDAGDPQSGFVVDFGVLDRLVRRELIDPFLDHRDLNESIPELPYTSAEYLAAWIVGWCARFLQGRPELGRAQILEARLWETERSWAVADREDARQLGFLPPA